jgi:hypothetical protein
MINCDRCGAQTHIYTLSWFNTQSICIDCLHSEEAHPDFAYAKQVESSHVAKGNLNFQGVGWPGVEGRVPKPVQ